MNNIVAIVGLCGSGKSEVSNYFEEKGYEKIHFGSITMEEMQRQNLPVNEKNEKLIREKLRKEKGMGVYALLSLPKIENALKNGKNVLIDGLYSFSEYKILKEKYNFKLIVLAIYTQKKLRYERLSKRKVRPLTEKESEERDFAEIENIEKGGPIAIADYTVINNSGLDQLKIELDKFVNCINL
ncbi:MAG: AAA family ATPase [Spirochaetota bacterium]|nr:AAA family ATPase [Spirochaetota bacterium]